jgi:hypothetical protein
MIVQFAPALAAAQSPDARQLAWPGSEEGLLFAWRTANEEPRAFDAEGALIYGYGLIPHGHAWIDHDGRMVLYEGTMQAESVSPRMVSEVQKSGAFTLQAVVAPHRDDNDFVAEIIGFRHANERNFSLFQEGGKLSFWLRTSTTGPGGQRFFVGYARAGQSAHVAVTVADGMLCAYVDGVAERKPQAVEGDLSAWADRPLVFGEGWSGRLEGVALFDRALSPEEVLRDALAYARIVAARPPVPTLNLVGRLIGKSTIPTPEAIAPYTQSLAVFEYAVDRVRSGENADSTIYVVHWTILDRKPLPHNGIEPGTTAALTLEPFTANKQLESENLSDTVVEDFDRTWWFDAGGAALKFRIEVPENIVREVPPSGRPAGLAMPGRKSKPTTTEDRARRPRGSR